MVSFVHYPTEAGGSSTERFLDNVTLEGPVPVMVRDTLAAIRRNLSRRAVIGGAGRQDVWEYPETALREAFVNALVHRDLSSGARGNQVQVEMYRPAGRGQQPAMPGPVRGRCTSDAPEWLTTASPARWRQHAVRRVRLRVAAPCP